MNIRIGNDIKIKFTIRGPYGFDRVNVKQMRCYLVNTAFESHKNDCEIIKRFPREPFPQFYTPSKYTIHGCGPHHYHVKPYNKRDYSTFCPGFNDAHIWPYYNGFGIVPDKFVDGCCHPCGPIMKPGKLDAPTFLAPSVLEEEDNKASAYFPACEQLICGPYKLVVVLVVYDSGWGRNNLHTYTIDYGTLFNLVDDESGLDGNIIIDGDTGQVDGGSIKRLYFAKSDIFVNINSDLELGEYDTRSNLYDLYAVMENGSVVKYRYDMWQSNKLTFSSDDPIVDVTYAGQLIINDYDYNKQAVITVKDESSEATASITVHINNANAKEYIGFSDKENAFDLDFEAQDGEGRQLFQSVSQMAGNHHVENFNNGYYLWLISKEPIKDVNCKLLDVPLDDVQMLGDSYYCYRCPNPLIAINFDLTVEV